MPDNLDVAGFSLPPGTRERHSIELVELADGTAVNIPLDLINGAHPGPRLYLGAAIHGDEVDGVAILFHALADIDPKALRGSIVCVPVQHPLSFHADHRLPISQFMKSPLDQAPADAWTCFPGLADGNLAQILAATLFDMIRTCDYAVDIHTPTRGGRYVPIAILPHPSLGDQHRRAEDMAHAFGTGWIMRTDSGIYVADGILCVEATRAGVPCFTFETGEGGRLEREVYEDGAGYIRNVMRWLGMIDGDPKPPKTTHVMREFLGLRASRGGLLLPQAKLGDLVKAGDRLCSIVNIYGDEVETIDAPQDGVFVRATTLSTVSRGERAATLGLL
jgi:predicted deacylase